MPASDSNLDPVAWDLFVAQHVNALASKRKEAAEKRAAAEGVIPDKEKNPQPGGTKAVVYEGDNISVLLEVRSSSDRVNAATMFDYLLDKGVDVKLLNDALAKATTKTRPAHVFSSYLRVTD
jgi:hypothetical protein